MNGQFVFGTDDQNFGLNFHANSAKELKLYMKY